jgi:hypothetical protein
MARWASLVQAVPASDPSNAIVLAGGLNVRSIRETVEARLGGVRIFCPGISAVYAGLLLWTCHAASQQTNGGSWKPPRWREFYLQPL